MAMATMVTATVTSRAEPEGRAEPVFVARAPLGPARVRCELVAENRLRVTAASADGLGDGRPRAEEPGATGAEEDTAEEAGAKGGAGQDDQDALERIRAIVDEEWARRREMNPRLFNMSKYRFEGCAALAADGDEDGLLLRLSMTDYKTFVGTNGVADGTRFAEIQALGMQLANDPRAFLADPLGVGAVVLVQSACPDSPTEMVLLHRSQTTGEFQGFLDLPGGHPEPSRVNASNTVVEELFGSITDEVRAEINLPVSTLGAPRLFAIVRQPGPSRGKASALFIVECTCSREEVLRRYTEGGEEADESMRLVFLPVDDDAVQARETTEQITFQGAPLTPQALFGLNWIARARRNSHGYPDVQSS